MGAFRVADAVFEAVYATQLPAQLGELPCRKRWFSRGYVGSKAWNPERTRPQKVRFSAETGELTKPRDIENAQAIGVHNLLCERYLVVPEKACCGPAGAASGDRAR